MVSFAVQKLLDLIRFLLLFAFVSFALGDWLKKLLLQFMLENVFPMFYSRSFMVARLIFKSLHHFELIFVYGVKELSNFVDLPVLPSFPNNHCLMHCPFFIVYSCILGQKMNNYKCECLLRGLLFCSTDLCVCFANTMLFWLLSLCSIVWSVEKLLLQLYSFPSEWLWQFWIFCGFIQILELFALVLWKCRG